MEKTDFRPRDRWLTYAFLIGPLAALTQLTVMYTLVPTACARASRALLHGSTAVFLVIALSGTVVGWRAVAWRSGPEFRDPGGDLTRERSRWLAVAAMALSIGSMIVIVALELPNLILRNCQ
jgi:hypothetical protein